MPQYKRRRPSQSKSARKTSTKGNGTLPKRTVCIAPKRSESPELGDGAARDGEADGGVVFGAGVATAAGDAPVPARTLGLGRGVGAGATGVVPLSCRASR